MSRAYSKLTAKSQTTVPKPVRDALGLHPGDAIAYEIEDGLVTLKREARLEPDYLKALQGTLEEWNTAEDAAAYDDL